MDETVYTARASSRRRRRRPGAGRKPAGEGQPPKAEG